MELKKYQNTALETLESFLQELKKVGPKYAFMGITQESYKSDFFGEVPFVCVKIPTGGGKTLVGCHAVPKIMSTVLQNKLDKGIVMWFTPSEAIKSQTLKKFKDRKDWHRRILDEEFDNNVKVFSNEEALSIRKEDISDNLCIIISSLDAFRKEKTLQNKYKVYQENGSLLDHFQNIGEPDSLERDSEGTIINSLANVVRLNSPLIAVDEGHKTQTKLSVDFLKDLNPSFIIEYTATPRNGSNVLVDIHSSELKNEEMVKIPIVLESATQWQKSVEEGIRKQKDLEKAAKKLENEYIRPIVLIQAQPQSKVTNNVTVDNIKDFLLEMKINPEEIAIKTSEKNEIEGVDLFSRKCKIRYIITVSALAEGWDCSFAYILVSVANLGAKIAVEQIIGRILRMPYARKKEIEDLNRSYVFASARNFNEAASQIISGLEDNGYSKYDFVNGEQEKQDYPLEVGKAVQTELNVPLMSFEDSKLSFEDLIGEKFELSKQDHEFDFDIHYDNDGRAIIDIKDNDEWIKGAQLSLNLGYEDRNYTKEELIQWLDKKLRFPLLEKSDKVAFLNKAIDYQLSKRTLTELSVNRYLLLDKLNNVIDQLLENFAKNNFELLLDKKTISVKPFEAFPETITLKQIVPQEFNKNLYTNIDKLNKEEQNFVDRLDLDTLPNIKFWVRNREKIDPFYIQGWKKGKFYPDFVAVTETGKIIALEWKGEDRVSNEDTKYKEEIAKVWQELGNGKLYFFLVHNENIEEVLTQVKNS
ncbi:MAG: DEAD/DEAH box helicase family protein [Patescibacteria group bacterium]|nr:DEAD/DEAH box helicase family protein [Patescibacteria group bacterium]MCL5409869.1 DEAD/DEAH box helicase family protein [Patescibacteria group bacterium]